MNTTYGIKTVKDTHYLYFEQQEENINLLPPILFISKLLNNYDVCENTATISPYIIEVNY